MKPIETGGRREHKPVTLLQLQRRDEIRKKKIAESDATLLEQALAAKKGPEKKKKATPACPP